MKKKVSLFIAFLIIGLLLLNLISAQTVVQKEQPKEEEKKGFFASLWSGITSPLFIGILIFAIVFILIVFLIAFIFVKIIRYLKLRTDLFFKLKTERIKLAKNQSRYINCTHWWKIEKNVPIRTMKKNEEGELVISKPLAYYRGDFLSHEGNIMIAVNFPNRKKWWFFPMIDLIILPNKRKVSIVQTVKDGKIEKTEIDNIPIAKELARFLDNEIIIFAESISMSGEFFFPVVKDKDGKAIDLAMPIYQSLKEVVIENYLYCQCSDFVEIARKSVDINPHLRIAQKMSDTNSSAEIPDMNRRN
jgi:hypothetical protein